MSAIVLGVSGGIAAFKSAQLLRLFTEAGHDVHVIPTSSALEFVGKATWEALSANPVRTDVFTDVDQVAHVKTGQNADLVVVAPATANLLAKAAHGIADDMLTTTLLTARCPILLAPAMHTEMWDNPATAANVQTLRARGIVVLEPAVGRLTGPDTGKGRIAEPEQIFAAAVNVLEHKTPDLKGRHIVVSAGGAREAIDPVRWLGNRSSGRQGLAIAEAAAARGARVTLVAANVDLATPAGVDRIDVTSTAELREAVMSAAKRADSVVMAAAPADFRPVNQAQAKIKKNRADGAPVIELVENPDILVELVNSRAQQTPFIVGFAAETGDERGDVLDHARTKLARKGCDLLVVNDVSADKVFGQDTNEVWLLSRDSNEKKLPKMTKRAIGHAICDAIVAALD